MCANCISRTEVIVGQAVLAYSALKNPVQQALADLGLSPEPDPVKHDVRTVAFLRSLALDPVAILGQRVVADAQSWSPAAPPERLLAILRRLRSAGSSSNLPIGSQSLIAAE